MTRHWTLLHSSLFAGGILILGLLAGWRASAVHLPDSASLINGERARKFETNYDEVFPAKNFGVSLWAAIEFVLFGEGRPGVRIGEQGWLYTAEEFKTHADAEQRIARHLGLIAWVRDELAQRNARLLVALVPAKARLYPEYRGAHQPAQVHRDLHPRFQRELLEARLLAPDLLGALNACKTRQPVFLRTDTHWTPFGAQCSAQAIGRTARTARLTTATPLRYRTRMGAPQVHRGDLFKFLPLDPYFAVLLPAQEMLAPPVTEAGSAAAPGLLDGGELPRVTLVGTSYSQDERWNFAGALREALREALLNYSNTGKGPFVPMLDYLRSEELREAPPRLVIWEIPERYLPMAEDLNGYELPAALVSPPSQKEKTA